MNRKGMLACVAVVLASSVASAQDVTGDFKVTGLSYANDVASVSGTVNHGAIQSRKTVVVDLTYDYSFVAEKTVTIPGETTTILVFVPGKCVTGVPNREGCFDRDGVTPKNPAAGIWTGSYVPETTTTAPSTVTLTFNGSQGMTAITEPTVEKGRLNPKGKITGYNWTATQSIVPNADAIDPNLIPAGYSVVSVTINSVSYTAYLQDASGAVIPDTVFGGSLYQ